MLVNVIKLVSHYGVGCLFQGGVVIRESKAKGRRAGFCRFPIGLAHSRVGGEVEVGRIVNVSGKALSALGCKLLVVLLDNAQRSTSGNVPAFDPEADRAEIVLHRIRPSELAILSGEKHGSTDRMNAGLAELSSISMEFDICDADGDVAWDFVGSLVQFGRRRDGWISYWFNPAIWPVLQNPRVYSRVFVEAARTLKSQYAIRLYQATAAYAGREDNVFRADRAQLEDLLGVPDSYRANFTLLRKHVLDPALREVNAKTEIDLVVSADRVGRGGTVSDFEFEIRSKAKSPVVEDVQAAVVENQAALIASEQIGSQAWFDSAVQLILGTGGVQ